MSDKGLCPHHPELITQLRKDVAAPLREHLAECAECQAELAQLRDGFAAMGEDLLGGDEQAQQRIAAQVMPQILADLARAAVPEPQLKVAPPPGPLPGLPQLLLAGARAALAVVPAALLWTRLGDALLKPAPALGLALLPLGLLPALLGSARLRGTALCCAIALTVALQLSTVDGIDVALWRGSGCLLLAASSCLLPAIVVLRTASRQHAGALSGALLGAAIGSGGAALQRLLCGIGGLPHALVFHLGPFLFLIALAGLLGSRVARPTAAAQTTAQAG